MSDDYDYAHVFALTGPGPRPPFCEVVDHVYGVGSNVDTEGDSYDRDTVEWTSLYMQLRPPREDLLRENPVVEVWMDRRRTLMFVGSDDEALASRTASFLAARTGAALSLMAPSP